MPVAFIWLLMPLSFPLSFFGIVIVGVLQSEIISLLDLRYQTYPGVLLYWITSVAVGYLQWFVILPKVVRCLSRTKN